MYSFFVIIISILLSTPGEPSRAVTKTANNSVTTIRGVASFYSRDGCVGCSKNLKMANGELFDDSKMTIAFQKTKLNTIVIVKNPATGKFVQAKVTDRGGYERLGRVADLSLAVKNAIGCNDLCQVEIAY
jgi:rare lipoprotein A (peptidoglycan hydrolase)